MRHPDLHRPPPGLVHFFRWQLNYKGVFYLPKTGLFILFGVLGAYKALQGRTRLLFAGCAGCASPAGRLRRPGFTLASLFADFPIRPRFAD